VRRTITYGTAPQADLSIHNIHCGHMSCEFSLRFQNKDLGLFSVAVPGLHNVLNATAAVAVALELEVPHEIIREGLTHFSGVDRRFQTRGSEAGITVVDDYGHHPTEVKATLAAARQCNYNRIHVIFQPHRYTRTMTRTMHLMDDFAKAFHAADFVYMLDIYAASEKPIEGVTAEALTDRLRAFGHKGAIYSGTLERAVDMAKQSSVAGDLVLTLGAGNVWQAGDRLLESLKSGGAT
jgi:UDP-N-acetylmuramate--alanine ligase